MSKEYKRYRKITANIPQSDIIMSGFTLTGANKLRRRRSKEREERRGERERERKCTCETRTGAGPRKQTVGFGSSQFLRRLVLVPTVPVLTKNSFSLTVGTT